MQDTQTATGIITSIYYDSIDSTFRVCIDKAHTLNVRLSNFQSLAALALACEASKLVALLKTHSEEIAAARKDSDNFSDQARIAFSDTFEAVNALGPRYFATMSQRLKLCEIAYRETSFDVSEARENDFGELESRTRTIDFIQLVPVFTIAQDEEVEL